MSTTDDPDDAIPEPIAVERAPAGSWPLTAAAIDDLVHDSLDPDDDGAVAEFVEEHPQAVAESRDRDFLLAHVECKHCPAVKVWEGEEV